ncbi:hypothetical protein [Paenibacillus sp. KN14-4R]|uniref:hypothetical protein n=1 Tax=Paenibacillus sp. KN14-4R TaxID=3445773 RepID=UPI003FA01CFA
MTSRDIFTYNQLQNARYNRSGYGKVTIERTAQRVGGWWKPIDGRRELAMELESERMDLLKFHS